MENKYKRIEDFSATEIKEALKKVQKDIYYPSYHIAPQTGLLNDPNGLIKMNETYYFHYQVHPVDPIHGLKYWELVTTKDFVNYDFWGLSNKPELESESHGVFSGSAFLENDEIKILYTGNHRDKNNVRHQTQILGTLNKQNKVVNKANIIEHDFELFDEHIRDPKIITIDQNKYIYFGAKNKKDQQGTITFYDYNTKKHAFNLKLKVKDFGFMWECPNIEKINNKYLIIFCPQGAESNDKITFKNSHSVVYCVADDIDIKTGTLINETYPKLVDFGTDYYAPQFFEADKKLLAQGWLGTLEVVYPSDKNSWQGMLTILREISLENNLLIQKPASEFVKNVLTNVQTITTNCLNISSKQMIKLTICGEETIKIGNDKYYLLINFDKNKITVDRSFCQEMVQSDFGDIRECSRNHDEQVVEIWLDNSVAEIFVNNYETTFSTRFFIKDINKLTTSKSLNFEVGDIKESKFNNK